MAYTMDHDPQLRLDVSLTWAVPVRADHLGAHVQAYLKTQAARETLRFCNLSGIVPNVPQPAIRRLPREIVDGIIGSLVRYVARDELQSWSQKRECYELSCDHPTPEDFHQAYHDLDDEPPCDDNECLFWSMDIMSDVGIRVTLAGLMGAKVMKNVHEATKDRWSQKWELFANNHGPNFMNKRLQLRLEKDFGNHAWAKTLQLPPLKAQDLSVNDAWKSAKTRKTTWTYLTLPKAKSGGVYSNFYGQENETPSEISAACCLLVSRSTLSEDPPKRFARALRILGLKPWVRQQVPQRDPTGSVSDSDDGDAAVADKEWPQLMMLAHNNAWWQV